MTQKSIQNSVRHRVRWILSLVALVYIGVRIGVVVVEKPDYYFSPYYTEEVYKHLEDTFNRSQYRLKNPTALIPDETVFSYAAGAYLHGIDPILINSEHTPLGKYLIALFIILLKNDRFIVIPFSMFTFFSLWYLGFHVLHDKLLALVPVVLFSSERLFLDQIRYAPLLDIIQLPFILFTLTFFIREYFNKKFVITSLMIGIVMATKTVIPAILLVVCFLSVLFIQKDLERIRYFLLYLPISVIILFISYTRTFLSGYSIGDFIGFQKWILLYQKSKLIFPFSVWRLIFLNQWQAWWGDMRILKADDWSITWPIITLLTFCSVFIVNKQVKLSREYRVVIAWVIIYSAFLSIGVVSSRFLLPFLPVLYIVSTLCVKSILTRWART